MKHVLPAAIAFALLPALPPVSAAAAPPKNAAPLAALSLALRDNSNATATETPTIDARLTNLSPQALWLRWTPPYPIVFQVEYKPVLDMPSRETGWTRLTPIPLPPEPAPDPFATVVESHVEKLKWVPGEQNTLCSLPTGFLLDEVGFYRIHAVLTFRKDGRNLISPDPLAGVTRLQPIDLALSAPPLLLNYTAAGYAVITEIHTGKTP